MTPDGSPVVIGLDPGLAHLGWAAVRLEEVGERPMALGLVATSKRSGQGVLVTDDLHRRGQELARALAAVLDAWPGVLAVCAESISYPRNAGSAAMIGRAWGVIDALLERRGLPLLSASPKAIKRAATGLASASKAAVFEALDQRYSGAVARLLRPIRATTKHEHPVDALGAVVACLDHDHLRLARRARQARLPLGAPVLAEGGGS